MNQSINISKNYTIKNKIAVIKIMTELDKSDYNASSMARKVIYGELNGILSTISVDVNGYPFGSVTPFCIDRDGNLIILISNIAQHTKNIIANNKVSITIAEKADGRNVQTKGRFTFIGDATFVLKEEMEDISERYIRYYPESKNYFKAHGFEFYRITLKRGRFIGGFGKIFWLEPEELLIKNPFSKEAENDIIIHMNNDHQHSMKKYFKKYYEIEVGNGKLDFVGIDAEGCDIRYEGGIHRFNFEVTLENFVGAKDVLSEMAQPN